MEQTARGNSYHWRKINIILRTSVSSLMDGVKTHLREERDSC